MRSMSNRKHKKIEVFVEIAITTSDGVNHQIATCVQQKLDNSHTAAP